MTVAEEAGLSLQRIQRLLNLPRTAILQLVDAGFIAPGRGPRKEYRFSFRDAVLLKTAHELRAAKIPTRKILQALTRLKEALPEDGNVTSLRLSAIGSEVVVHQGAHRYVANSGQLLLDLEISEPQGTVAVLQRPDPPAEERSAQAWFEEGESQEEQNPSFAEQAYRAALQADPSFPDAYLNLGALLCESGRCEEAAHLYERALANGVNEALLHFNRAVALEDLNRPDEAAASYERALTLDPELADAHFNLAHLHERLGHFQVALRHFNAYRRLQRLQAE